LAISQLEESFASKYESFEEVVNKRLEKLQKTINSILQTLNDLHDLDSSDNTRATLSNSKSAVKLKTFFGFKM
jgi:prefoldin subunit 5